MREIFRYIFRKKLRAPGLSSGGEGPGDEDRCHVEKNNSCVIRELCHIVAYYHLVEAVDNGSDIHSKLRVNANDALTYWTKTLTVTQLFG